MTKKEKFIFGDVVHNYTKNQNERFLKKFDELISTKYNVYLWEADRIIKDRHYAKDLVQEVLIIVYFKYNRRNKDVSTLHGYIKSLIKYASLKYLSYIKNNEVINWGDDYDEKIL